MNFLLSAFHTGAHPGNCFISSTVSFSSKICFIFFFHSYPFLIVSFTFSSLSTLISRSGVMVGTCLKVLDNFNIVVILVSASVDCLFPWIISYHFVTLWMSNTFEFCPGYFVMLYFKISVSCWNALENIKFCGFCFYRPSALFGWGSLSVMGRIPVSPPDDLAMLSGHVPYTGVSGVCPGSDRWSLSWFGAQSSVLHCSVQVFSALMYFGDHPRICICSDVDLRIFLVTVSPLPVLPALTALEVSPWGGRCLHIAGWCSKDKKRDNKS